MVACLSAAMSGSTDPGKQVIPSARRILEKSDALQTAINRSSGYLVWKPDIERIERVVVKNARSHAFFEIGEPMIHKPASVRVIPLEYMSTADRAEFESVGGDIGLLPEVVGRMMTRLLTGQDLTEHGWVLVQEGVYRYLAIQAGLMTVRTVLHDFLTTEVYLGPRLTAKIRITPWCMVPNLSLRSQIIRFEGSKSQFFHHLKSGQQPSSSSRPVRTLQPSSSRRLPTSFQIACGP
jgi:hypothetical protein